MTKTITERIISAAMLLLLAAALLTGCTAGGENGNGTLTQTDSSETASAESDSLKLIESGLSQVKIIVPDTTGRAKTGADEANASAAISIRNALALLTSDGKQPMGSDWTISGEHDPDAVEILVGRTEYEEGREDIEKVGLGSYMVRAYGKKIVVFSHTESGYTEAVRKFSYLFLKYLDESEIGNSLEIPAAEIDFSGSADSGLSALPFPDGTSFSSLYNSGEGCRVAIFTGATGEQYESYLEKLQSSGYTFYVSNSVKGQRFSTLYNGSVTLNLWLNEAARELKVIIEPFSGNTLIGKESDNVFTRVTTPLLTMIGVSFTNEYGDTMDHGMCFLIRLSDGRFIIIDGGFNRDEHARSLISAIKDQASGYASNGEYTVAAWIVTHSHEDHNGLINGQYQKILDAGIKVEKVMLNFLDKDEMKRCIDEWSINWDAQETSTWAGTYRAVSGLGATQVVPHVGQVFWFADLKIEVLYTLECIAPDAADAMNSTSLIMKMTFSDPSSGRQTTYMSTGDATGKALFQLSSMYGDYLKTDVLQLAHHGMVTFGWTEGTIAAYRLMSPSVLLWPVGEGDYPNLVNKEYNRQAWDPEYNPNIREVYVAGHVGNRTTLEMPYHAGTAVVTK